METKNVIKSAPEVTFWAVSASTTGTIFIQQDYFFLDYIGIWRRRLQYSAGPGSLAFAYFGGIQKRHWGLLGARMI